MRCCERILLHTDRPVETLVCKSWSMSPFVVRTARRDARRPMAHPPRRCGAVAAATRPGPAARGDMGRGSGDALGVHGQGRLSAAGFKVTAARGLAVEVKASEGVLASWMISCGTRGYVMTVRLSAVGLG